MKRFLSVLFAIVISVSAMFCLTACGEKYSYWQIVAMDDGADLSTARLVSVSELSFGNSYVEITEIWVNVSDLRLNNATVSFVLSNASSTTVTHSYELTAEAIKQSKDGWINMYYGEAKKATKASVEVFEEMRINEVVFIKADGSIAEVTFSRGGVKASSGKSEAIYDKAGLDALTEGAYAYNENPCYNIVDEQDKFPVEYIKTKKA